MSETTTTYADTRWPWRITITYADGSVRNDDYADDFQPLGFAQHLSSKPNVVRVEVTTVYVNGEQVSPVETGAGADEVTVPASVLTALIGAPATENAQRLAMDKAQGLLTAHYRASRETTTDPEKEDQQ
jgi:hypothetical protein